MKYKHNNEIVHFLVEFPFQPPKIFFKTKIYHPNVGAQGEVCLPILDTDKWQQDTQIIFVIIALVNLVNNPEPLNYLRKGIAIGNIFLFINYFFIK